MSVKRRESGHEGLARVLTNPQEAVFHQITVGAELADAFPLYWHQTTPSDRTLSPLSVGAETTESAKASSWPFHHLQGKDKRYKEHSRAGWFCFTLCHLPLLLPLLVSPSWEAVIGKNPKETRASLVAQMVKNPPAMWETWVRSLGWEDPLQEGMATHCNTRALRIPWTEEPGRLQSLGSHRVGHNWSD